MAGLLTLTVPVAGLLTLTVPVAGLLTLTVPAAGLITLTVPVTGLPALTRLSQYYRSGGHLYALFFILKNKQTPKTQQI